MSLCDALDLLAYWRESPPVHVIMAARYLGGKKRSAAPPPPAREGEITQLTSFLGPVRPMPARSREMLEWAETAFKNGR